MGLLAWRNIGLINLAVLAGLAAGTQVGLLLPHGPYLHGAGIDGQMLTWDGLWYENIATHGYQWNPAIGETLGQHQNIAFFPLYPAIDWTAMRMTGSARAVVYILPGLIFGLLSNAAFYKLAATFTPRPIITTALFAAWPACCFHVMGYPAGLINLCVIMALLDYTGGKRWRAAFWCGVGTAAAPTVVFVAMALALDAARGWWQTGHSASAVPKLAAFGTVCVFGLAGFMLYQTARFSNPFAFIAAQRGFTRSLPFGQHVLLVFDPLWYAVAPQFAWAAVQNAMHHGLLNTAAGREVLCAGFQLVLDLIVLVAWICLLSLALRPHKFGVIALAGWLVTLGYIWFMATTDKGLVNGIRMLYPAVAVFLVLGRMNMKTAFAAMILAVLAVLAILETALISAGYAVI